MRLSSARSRVEHQKVIVHLFVYFHDTSFVSTSVTVVWCAKHCDNLLVVTPIKALNSLTCSIYLPSSPTNELWQLFWGRFVEGITLLCLSQTCIPHHEERYPIPLSHQGPTRADHTLAPHEALLVLCQDLLFGQEYLGWEKDHRVSKISDSQQLQWVVDSRINRWKTSTHLHYRTFACTHRKNHKLKWFICFRGFLLKWWVCLEI